MVGGEKEVCVVEEGGDGMGVGGVVAFGFGGVYVSVGKTL